MVIIGKVGSPCGLKGLVKIHSYTEKSVELIDYLPWMIQQKGDYYQLQVSDISIRNHQIVARLNAAENRDEAARLTNCLLAVPRERLKKLRKDEYYWQDLIGLKVMHVTGLLMGHVTSLIETGANDVLVIWDPARQKEHLVPFLLAEVIVHVDLAKQTIIVNWDPEF